MEAVYGRKRRSDGRVTERWMDRFVELVPEGGFQAVVEQVWSHNGAASSSRAALSAVLNGHTAIAPVYGRRVQSMANEAPETWMDRFVTMEPEGGFRDVVKRALNGGARNGA